MPRRKKKVIELRRECPEHLWTYYAEVLRWYDGDTVTLKIDKGLKDSSVRTMRLVGIDTPETRGRLKWGTREQAKEATAFVRKKAPTGTRVLIETHKPDGHNYGRWLGEIWVGGADEPSINQQLLDAGLARKMGN